MKKVAIALIATLALAGCSSTPKASTTSQSSANPTTASQKVDATVCKAVTDEISSVAQAIQGMGTTTSVADAITALTNATDAWAAKAAEANQPEVAAWFTSMSTDAGKLRAALDASDFSNATIAIEKALVVDMLKIQTFCQ